jgi:redox-sensitive bicupin YhaK (pirin superfamily)
MSKTPQLGRRDVLRLIAASGLAPACSKPASEPPSASGTSEQVPTQQAQLSQQSRSAVVTISPLPAGNLWPTQDPFLFCAHHDDHYPQGSAEFGPSVSLQGRNLGSDFSSKDGWSMYHGRVVPGFPQHPHRGFETVTVVRQGLLDHSDSLGAAARYGHGDVQWLTAGSGIQHAEMFPLLKSASDNPLELFQIWLNLPKVNKFAAPYFSMLWSKQIPTLQLQDNQGRGIEVSLKAGKLGDAVPPSPPPQSWAANPENEVAIWSIKLQPGATWLLPKASPGLNRTLYFFRGSSVAIAGQSVPARQVIELLSDLPVELSNGADESELLLLQGRPIAEPMAKHGPFVMNTQQEIRDAYADYRETQFGGWPWPKTDPVHGPDEQRFARYIDGRVERPA